MPYIARINRSETFPLASFGDANPPIEYETHQIVRKKLSDGFDLSLTFEGDEVQVLAMFLVDPTAPTATVTVELIAGGSTVLTANLKEVSRTGGHDAVWEVANGTTNPVAGAVIDAGVISTHGGTSADAEVIVIVGTST